MYMRTVVLSVVWAGVFCALSSCASDSNTQISSADTQGKSCPDWSSNPVSNYSNEDFSNLGCATKNNLQVQLKNPADYEHGSGKTVINVLRDGGYVQGYLSGVSASSGSASSSSSVSSGSR